MSGCLGDAVAALVDGELDHAGRERVHRHLARCAGCRAEVEAQRRVKAGLRAASVPSPSDALTARLFALAASPTAEGRDGPGWPVDHGRRPAPLPVVRDPGPAPLPERRLASGPLRRPAAGPAGARPTGARAPAGRPVRARALRRRATAGSAFALLGVAAALALGAPPQRPTSTPVDPTTQAFVTEFVSTTGSTSSRPGSPSAEPLTRAEMPFVPATRAALLTTAPTTTGGARSLR